MGNVYLASLPLPLPEPCLFQVYQNVDFPGVDYRTLFTHDYEECQRACTQDLNCQFFTFANEVFTTQKIRYKCFLKFSWSVPWTPIVERKVGVVSGFSHKAQVTQDFGTACQGKLISNSEISESDFQVLPAGSPEHCQTLCSAHPLCTYFSYHSITLTCHLKNNPNEMVTIAKEGVTSGIPARFCRLNDSWIEVSLNQIDFRGSDIKFDLMDDPDMCQQTCTEDINCQFYTYVKEDFYDNSFWHRCYRKRVITMPAPPKVTKLTNVVSGFSLKNCV